MVGLVEESRALVYLAVQSSTSETHLFSKKRDANGNAPPPHVHVMDTNRVYFALRVLVFLPLNWFFGVPGCDIDFCNHLRISRFLTVTEVPGNFLTPLNGQGSPSRRERRAPLLCCACSWVAKDTMGFLFLRVMLTPGVVGFTFENTPNSTKLGLINMGLILLLLGVDFEGGLEGTHHF